MEKQREQAWRLAAKLARQRRKDRWNEVFNDRHAIEEQEYYNRETCSSIRSTLASDCTVWRNPRHSSVGADQS
jgi:hypothetical protein